MSAETGLPIALVCRVTSAPRSTIYARQGGAECAASRKRGPRTELSDDQLTALIREIVTTNPFVGEGYRKVTARLGRQYRVFVGRNRVLRLMRGAGLLAPQRARGRRRPRAHDGTITMATS